MLILVWKKKIHLKPIVGDRRRKQHGMGEIWPRLDGDLERFGSGLAFSNSREGKGILNQFKVPLGSALAQWNLGFINTFL